MEVALSIYHSLFTIYHFRLSRSQRVEDAEGRARGVGEVCEPDGRGVTFADSGADGAHLFALPLVLRAQAAPGLASPRVGHGRAIVFDDERATGTENLDVLFGERAVALGEIRNRAVRPVGELERDEDRVFVNGFGVVGCDRLGVDRCDVRAGDVLHEVHEVADLAADAPAALARVLRPVRARHAPRVDAIENRERPAPVFEELLSLTRVRGEAPVEADRQSPF